MKTKHKKNEKKNSKIPLTNHPPPPGFGFHGDFLNGWDEDTLQAGIDQCAIANADGVVDECPVFAPIDDKDTDGNCPPRAPLIDEPVHGTIDKLPGCITITPGPQEATLADFVCPAGVTEPVVNVSFVFFFWGFFLGLGLLGIGIDSLIRSLEAVSVPC